MLHTLPLTLHGRFEQKSCVFENGRSVSGAGVFSGAAIGRCSSALSLLRLLPLHGRGSRYDARPTRQARQRESSKQPPFGGDAPVPHWGVSDSLCRRVHAPYLLAPTCCTRGVVLLLIGGPCEQQSSRRSAPGPPPCTAHDGAPRAQDRGGGGCRFSLWCCADSQGGNALQDALGGRQGRVLRDAAEA